MEPHLDWKPVIRTEAAKPYWAELQSFLADERSRSTVYPPELDVLAALAFTALSDVRVVILGQDPYHGPGQAHGLAFSVRPPTAPPPSLRNIHTELMSDIGSGAIGGERPTDGSLIPWAKQGVLLLNTVLTVRDGEANSHRRHGWEHFTDALLEAVNDQRERVVFMLWGAAAQKKASRIDTAVHAVITAPHPSPLSAHRGFLGSRPFSTANELLTQADRTPIDWAL